MFVYDVVGEFFYVGISDFNNVMGDFVWFEFVKDFLYCVDFVEGIFYNDICYFFFFFGNDVLLI